jgi:hypothetical protein
MPPHFASFSQAWRRHAHSSVHGRIDSLLNFLLTLPAPSHNAPHAGDWWKDSAHSGQAVGREESALLSQPSAISAMSLQNTSHASVSRSGGGGRSWEGGGATTATTSSWTAPHIIRAPAPGAARQHGPVLQQGGGEQWEFTTIPLSREDKQLLFEAEVKLRVTDSSAVRGVLSYISSALIEDFPPEVREAADHPISIMIMTMVVFFVAFIIIPLRARKARHHCSCQALRVVRRMCGA